ncbi:MAG TPA: translation initiation factor IF-3, partial [Spirochaetales bacterium]|nr:translation initiation factor IF-3 [Spirochaetales bacterium]
MASKELRINKWIQAREIRLIDDQGNQKGIIPT